MMTLPRTSYGVVDKAIGPRRSGRIKFEGSYWKAELADPNCGSIEVGEIVKVVGRQGIGLLVMPEAYEFPAESQKRVGDRWGIGQLFSL